MYVDLVTPVGTDGLDCVRRFVLGDAHARFRRARGEAVLFAPAIGGFAEETEAEAARQGISPDDLIDSFVSRLRERCDLLEISCDWEQRLVTSRPELCRRTQRIFLELFGQGLVYQRDLPAEGDGDRAWHLRCDAFAAWCDQNHDDLDGWTGGAVEAQREALGRVDGVEIEAAFLGGGRAPVFTPYRDAVGEAAFVAISPHHPDVQTVATSADLEQLRGDPGPTRMVQTAGQAAVPGVDDLLPVVVTPAVDARFGPTLSLGIPDRDDIDCKIAARLVKSAGLPFRTSSASSKPRAATRFRFPDLPVSRIGKWGVPIPIVHCVDCGTVPLDAGEAPVVLSNDEKRQAEACDCPKCGEPARRDGQVIDGQFDRMWAWMAIPIPPDDRESSSLARRSELDSWLPVRQVVWGENDAKQLLTERIAARAANELAPQGEGLPEAFAKASICGAVSADAQGGVGSVEELDELVARVGADAVRLTILHSASAGRPTSWSPASLRHSQRFLDELRDYAASRLSGSGHSRPLEIDRSTRLRRRLAAWCEAAETKVSANLEQLLMHRATYDLMLFLKRIRDFELRSVDTGGGELTELDRDAVAVALRRLIHLAAPCVPNVVAELESVSSTGQPLNSSGRPDRFLASNRSPPSSSRHH